MLLPLNSLFEEEKILGFIDGVMMFQIIETHEEEDKENEAV